MEKSAQISYSLNRNTINIFGVINTDMSERVINLIQYLDDKDVDEITLQINSSGGSITAALAIIDTLSFVRADIATVCIGQAIGMAAVLLSAGSKWKRKATAHSEIILYQPTGGVDGQTSDIVIEAAHIKKTRDLIRNILSENTGKSFDVIAKDTERNFIMDANEAQNYGLIDIVIPYKSKAKEQ